ncbi:MAG: DNA polymerase III subunit alpha, partial [Chloroflexota bacterium]
EVDRAAKLIPNIPGKPVSIAEALEEVNEFKELYKSEQYLRELIDTASQMEGVVRNAGTHAAGVIITDKPTIEYIPLHRPTGSSAEESPVKTVTQFEMSTLESLGLLKVDFLGLATLTIMARACDLIHQRHGIELNLQNIPVDDPGTYELMGRGDTAGVFQVEGSGMRRWLMQMKPKELANVIAMVALFRPGPMEFIPSYIRRMHGEEEITYRHPGLEPILKETYGITVYQEQIMYTAMKLAGYTASEADNLRKGVAKKKVDVLLKHRQTFVKGAVANGISEDIANQIFDDWEAFARYGFPKGHAADYGVIAVQTAYLKLHYPVEYMTALLSVNQNDTAKVALYIADCRRMKIAVHPPDINISDWDFIIEDSQDGPACIRFGLGAIKNVGHAPVDAILDARKDGKFEDLNDLARRVDMRQVGKRALESLIRVGALDQFGSRPALLAAIDRIVSVSSSHFRASEAGQMSLFGAHTGVIEEITLPVVNAEVNRREILNWEKELIGLYVSDHPLSPVMDMLTNAVTHFSGQLSEAAPGERVRVAGLITRSRSHQTKTGKQMGFVTIEDVQGNIELVIFPRTWEKLSNIIETDKIVLVDGKVDAEGAEPKVLVDSITTEFKYTTPLVPPPAVKMDGSVEPPSPSALRPAANEKPAVKEKKAVAYLVSQPAAPEAAAPPEDDLWESDSPPPPDAFPPDWSLGGVVLKTVATTEAVAQAKAEHPEEDAQAGNQPVVVQFEAASSEAGPDETHSPDMPQPGPISEPQAHPEPEELGPLPEPHAVEMTPADKLISLPPYILSPLPPADGENVHMITVIMRSTGDKTRDVLRMRRVHGMASTYPGIDRFAFRVFERSRSYLVEFPNFTTRYCPELISRLNFLVGAENVTVEPITFQ